MPDLTLSKRETEVLQRIADGKLCKQVASDMHISERTVQATSSASAHAAASRQSPQWWPPPPAAPLFALRQRLGGE